MKRTFAIAKSPRWWYIAPSEYLLVMVLCEYRPYFFSLLDIISKCRSQRLLLLASLQEHAGQRELKVPVPPPLNQPAFNKLDGVADRCNGLCVAATPHPDQGDIVVVHAVLGRDFVFGIPIAVDLDESLEHFASFVVIVLSSKIVA